MIKFLFKFFDTSKSINNKTIFEKLSNRNYRPILNFFKQIILSNLPPFPFLWSSRKRNKRVQNVFKFFNQAAQK